MRVVLRSVSIILESAAIIVLSLLFSLSVYAISDNNQVFSDTETTQKVMLSMKPDDGDGTAPPNFDDLQKINEDVCAWITVDGTNIDYPVLQGSSNLTYLNKDVYGNFSLAGSIFMDASNDYLFRDRYSLMYGHHMDNHMMFGDLDLFKDEDFFKKNRTATLLTKKEAIDMQVFAIMEIPDSTEEIFNPTMWGKDLSKLVSFIKDHSMYVDSKAYELANDNGDSIQIVALATCTDGATGNRSILFLVAKRSKDSDPPVDDPPLIDDPPVHYGPPAYGPPALADPDVNDPLYKNKHSDKQIGENSIRPPAKTGDKLSDSPYFWLAIFVGSMMSLLILFTIRSRKL